LQMYFVQLRIAKLEMPFREGALKGIAIQHKALKEPWRPLGRPYISLLF